MSFLYLLEKIRNPVFDFIFSAITHIGEETVFLVVALLFFWCVNKREGYFILISGLVGTVINQAAKLLFKIPRPWVRDPSFTIVESARAEAAGYSFPSGHTQNVTTTFGSIGMYSKRTPVRIISIVIVVLVAFSRMYLGVHTPLDVCVSLAIGAAIVVLLYPIFRDEEVFHKFMPIVIAFSVLITFSLVLYVFLMSSDGVDPHNLASGRKNACTLLGCTLALIPVYILDRRYIKFTTDAAWYSQIFKFLGGLIGVLAIKVGLSAPLISLFGSEYVARTVRYFFTVIFAGALWPMTFGFFSCLRIKFLDRLTAK